MTIEIIAAGFDGADRATQVLDDLRAQDKAENINLLNSIAIRKDRHGTVSASGDGDLNAGGGALFGALVGALVGLLGGPGGAVVGAAAGALTGGITAAGIDMGFPNDMIEALQSSLRPDTSMILALVEPDWVERVSGEIELQRGKVVHHALREEFVARYRRAQDKARNKD